jgi:DNA modification methylase
MEITKLKIADLKDAPYNPRKSTVTQDENLKRSLEKFGLVDPIIFNKQTGNIVGGHFRVRELKKLGLKEVECVIVDLSPEDEKELNIRLNANTGEFDWEILSTWENQEQLTEWGLDLPGFDVQPEAQEDDYEIPDEIETDIILGDLFEIGEHRLLCGDSTDSDSVAKLMNGEKADMVFTSPPYNSGGNSGTGGYGGNKNRETKNFYNNQDKADNWTKEEYFDFCISVLNNISISCNDDTPILWNVMYNANSRDDYGKIVFSDLNPFSVKETIIWDKGVGMNICSTGILSRTCELIFLLSKGEKYYTNQNQDTYWNTWRISNKQGGNMKWGHGASFPVQLPSEGITKFSKEESIIYEPFTGSGPTMVASHQLNRKCYGMEIDPKYCQVIIDRMLKLDQTLIIKKNGEVYKTEIPDLIRT